MIKLIDSLIYKFICDLKIKYKLILSLSVFILLPILLLGISSYYMTQKYLEDSEKKSLIQSMTQLNKSIDYFFESYQNASAILFSSYDLQNALLKDVKNLSDAISARQAVSKITNQIANSFSFPEIKDTYYAQGNTIIELYVTNEKLASYEGDILHFKNVKNEEWCKKLFSSKSAILWQNNVINNDTQCVVLNRKLIDFNSTNNIGVMRLFIPYTRIKRIIQNNITNSNYKFLYEGEDQSLIASIGMEPEDTGLIMEMNNRDKLKGADNTVSINKSYIIGTITSQVTKWKLIFSTPIHTIFAKTRNILTLTVLSVVIAIFLCILISILISSFITKRINILVEKTNQIDKNNLSTTVKIDGSDEIGQLDRKFNTMLSRINDLIDKEYKAKIIVNNTKLELLQEQINPHMLYNTLSMISLVSEETGQSEILKVSNSLIGFYKGILNRGKIISTLGEEINMVKKYVEIMMFVNKMEIECIIDIDKALFKFYTMKLLLQPVVENSIIHGLRQVEGGILFIGGKETETGIELIVSDNGLGIEEETIKYLNSILENEDFNKSYGIGNVIKRINLFFGTNYGLKIESSPSSGTTVFINIPKLTENEIKALLKSKYLV